MGGAAGRGALAQRRDRAEEEEEEDDGERRGRGGERRQQRRVRKPQITTINHQAVNIFTCYDGLLLAAAWDLCARVSVFCVSAFCVYACSPRLSNPELLSPLSLSSPLLKLTA